MNTNIDWLIRRNVSPDVIESFGLYTDTHQNLQNCLVIPVHTPEGTFTFNKYRRDPTDDRKPKYLYDKGGHVTLYGANHLTPSHDYVVLTEGELDALVLWSMNIPAVSSTGGALSFQPEWASLLEGKQVYVCFDNDDAGSEGMVKVHGIIPTAKFIFIPEMANTKDITDFISHGGDFVGLLSSSVSYPDEAAVLEDMRKRSASWLPTRFHTAWIKKHQEQAQRFISSPITKRIIKDDKVLNAKQYPIPDLLKFNKRTGKALCPFHNEKTPSLHYYKATNTTYCFGGCGKAYDAIAIYQKLHGTDFRTTIEDLDKLI